jgi:hypothetical protein
MSLLVLVEVGSPPVELVSLGRRQQECRAEGDDHLADRLPRADAEAYGGKPPWVATLLSTNRSAIAEVAPQCFEEGTIALGDRDGEREPDSP